MKALLAMFYHVFFSNLCTYKRCPSEWQVNCSKIWTFVSVFRQQLHGPRASAGVYVEEEKAESDIEKYAEIHKSCVITCPSQHVFRKLAQWFVHQ